MIGTNAYANLDGETAGGARWPATPGDFSDAGPANRRGAHRGGRSSSIGRCWTGLAEVVGKPRPALFEACVAAAAAGATLGEVTRAVRIHDTARCPDHAGLPHAAVGGFERLRAGGGIMPRGAGRTPAGSFWPISDRQTAQGAGRLRAGLASRWPDSRWCPGASRRRKRRWLPPSRPGAGAVCLCSTDETYPALVPPLVQGPAGGAAVGCR
jgi:hypothetical protein